MSCGAPVVISNSSSLPEVGGEAALLFNPFDPGELASHLAELDDNPSLCEELRIKSLRQAEKFSWEQFSDEMLDILERYVKPKGKGS